MKLATTQVNVHYRYRQRYRSLIMSSIIIFSSIFVSYIDLSLLNCNIFFGKSFDFSVLFRFATPFAGKDAASTAQKRAILQFTGNLDMLYRFFLIFFFLMYKYKRILLEPCSKSFIRLTFLMTCK